MSYNQDVTQSMNPEVSESSNCAIERKRKPGRPFGARDSKPRQRVGYGTSELAQRLQRLESLGTLRGTSARVIAAMGGDAYWLRILSELEETGSWEKAAAVMQFHQSMRDGRAPQQINVTSVGVTINATDLERARAVVRELVPRSEPETQPPTQHALGPAPVQTLDADPDAQVL